MNQIANQNVEEFTAEAKRSMEEGAERMTKGFEDVARFGQDNVQALVASGKVVAKAAEEVNAELAAYTKKSYEDAVAASKELASARTVSEYVEKNTAFARASFEGFVAQATRLNELYGQAARDAFAPINARLTAATEMVRTYRA